MRFRLLTIGASAAVLVLLSGCSSSESTSSEPAASSTTASVQSPSPEESASRDASAGGAIPYVTDSDFRANQLVSGLPSIVEFTAPWCGGACETLKYQLEVNATFYGSAANFVLMDVEANPGAMQRYGIRGLPTLICFRADGTVNARRGTFANVPALESWIKNDCGV